MDQSRQLRRLQFSRYDLRADAGRYECGTLNTVGCFGHRASLEFLLEVGIANVGASVMARAAQLDQGLRALGYEVMLDRTPANGSGIISFRHPNTDAKLLVPEMRRNKITAAPRQGWVRVSPHFYISSEDIEQVLRTLAEIRKSQ